MGGSFFLNSLGSVAGGRGNGGKEQTAAHQHKEEQTAKAIHGDSVFHKVRQAAVQAASRRSVHAGTSVCSRIVRRQEMISLLRAFSNTFKASTCPESLSPRTRGRALSASVVSMKCAMGDNAMNISILEGYPFCAKLPAEHPCSSVCLRGGGILSGAFLHIGTASLDDKGAPCGYCTNESAWRTACLMHTPRTCL